MPVRSRSGEHPHNPDRGPSGNSRAAKQVAAPTPSRRRTGSDSPARLPGEIRPSAEGSRLVLSFVISNRGARFSTSSRAILCSASPRPTQAALTPAVSTAEGWRSTSRPQRSSCRSRTRRVNHAGCPARCPGPQRSRGPWPRRGLVQVDGLNDGTPRSDSSWLPQQMLDPAGPRSRVGPPR